MGRVLGAAVVPSAPLVLPEVSPGLPAAHAEDIAALRAAADRALSSLPASDAVVVVASGRRGVHGTATVDLTPLGLPEIVRTHPVADRLLPDVTSRTQYPQRQGDDLEIDLAVLALQLPEATPVLPVAVSPAEGPSLAGIGRGIVGAIRDNQLDVTLVVAGDLSTALDETSPRYVVEGALGWDQDTVEALRHVDVERLVAAGNDADRVRARSWAPLVVGLAAVRAAGLRPSGIEHRTARGVGYAVGSFSSA